jgi:hypothetical protein
MQVMRAKSAANRPGVQFVFVGVGAGVEKRQLLQLASERDPEQVALLTDEKEPITWQAVLTSVCQGQFEVKVMVDHVEKGSIINHGTRSIGRLIQGFYLPAHFTSLSVKG